MLKVEVIGVNPRLNMGSSEEKGGIKNDLQVLGMRNWVDEKKDQKESMGRHNYSLSLFCFFLEGFDT